MPATPILPQNIMPANPLKAALAAQRRQIGLWSSLGYAGFDWIVVDTEHAPSDPLDVLSQLQALATGTAEPVVRVAWNDPVLLKRLLDIGARSFLVPFVQNADEAAAAVSATRYPPHGIRGVSVSHRANRFGRVPNYLHTASEQMCVLVQLETAEALGNLEAIAEIDGVDGVFIGPSDLAADLGHLGNAAHPVVQTAIAEACARILAAGKPAGILAPVEADARRYFEMGFTFVAIGSDVGLLSNGSTALVNRMRTAIGEPQAVPAV